MNQKYRNSMYHYEVLDQSIPNNLDKPKLEIVPVVELKNLNNEHNHWGYGSFKPKCLQFLATLPGFTAVYFLTSVQFGLFFINLINTLTTLEKQFHLKSKSTGIIVASYEIGYIISILPITIYAGQRHRPRFMGLGIFGMMAAAIIYTFPNFIYGPPHIGVLSQGNTSISSHYFCNLKTNRTNESIIDCLNHSYESHGSNYGAFGIFMFGITVFGFSSATVTSLGFPFMDDNAPKGESGFYLGIIILSRLLGPILGFLLGALATSFYVDFSDPGFGQNSINWVGAWWLGFLIIAITMPISAILMLGFPRKLNQTQVKSQEKKKKLVSEHTKEKLPPNDKKPPKIKMKDVPSTIVNLMKNPVLVSRILADTCAVMGFMGFLSFMNKYIEAKFQYPTHEAVLMPGPVFMTGIACGIGLGSYLLKKKLVNLKQLTLMILIGCCIWTAGLIILMNIDCPSQILNDNWRIQRLNMSDACSGACLCNNNNFAPVCDLETMVSYFSPCHAGCNEFDTTNMTFQDCLCTSSSNTVVNGLCSQRCTSVYIYLVVMFFMIFMSTIPSVGNTLITLKCVPPHLKTIALGLEMLIVGALAVIPSPILYGSQVDASCSIWEKSECGGKEEGACKMYNGDEYRVRIHAIGATFYGLAIIPNFICWYYSRKWKFSDEDDDIVNDDIIIYEKTKHETDV